MALTRELESLAPESGAGYSRASFTVSGALFLMGAVLALSALGASSQLYGVDGVDLGLLGAGAMLVGMLGLVLTGLTWAARGPGAVRDSAARDSYEAQLSRRHRHRLGRT